MLSNSKLFFRYLKQYRELYGNQLLFDVQIDGHNFSSIKCSSCFSGNIGVKQKYSDFNMDNKIIFVGNFSKITEGLLTKILAAINLSKNDIYIFDLALHTEYDQYKSCFKKFVFCKSCLSFQLSIINPKLIVVFGKMLVESITNKKHKLDYVTDKIFDFHGTDLFLTFDLLDLINNKKNKILAWQDFKIIRDKYLLVN